MDIEEGPVAGGGGGGGVGEREVAHERIGSGWVAYLSGKRKGRPEEGKEERKKSGSGHVRRTEGMFLRGREGKERRKARGSERNVQ